MGISQVIEAHVDAQAGLLVWHKKAVPGREPHSGQPTEAINTLLRSHYHWCMGKGLCTSLIHVLEDVKFLTKCSDSFITLLV